MATATVPRALRVGFIGLGDMGEPMAHNLVAKGFPVSVFDVRPGPLQAAREKGASVASSLADMADHCDVIGICVWSEDQVNELLHGDGGLLSGTARDVTLLIHSTVTPQMVERTQAACALRGWRVLDAPVSGGRAGSVAGTLTLMVGGSKDDFDRCLPYFEAVGKNVFHVGERAGMGEVAKLCNNIMSLCNGFIVAETLKLAAAYGIDEASIVKVARVSTGNSWWIENPEFFDNLILTHPQPDVLSKDLWEALAAGREKGLDLLLSGVVALSAQRMTSERVAELRARVARTGSDRNDK